MPVLFNFVCDANQAERPRSILAGSRGIARSANSRSNTEDRRLPLHQCCRFMYPWPVRHVSHPLRCTRYSWHHLTKDQRDRHNGFHHLASCGEKYIFAAVLTTQINVGNRKPEREQIHLLRTRSRRLLAQISCADWRGSLV